MLFMPGRTPANGAARAPTRTDYAPLHTRDPALMDLDAVIAAANAVFDALGGGLTESCYQNALGHELRLRGHVVECEVTIPVTFKGVHVGALRADLLIDYRWILELKVVARTNDAHAQQLAAYLRARTECNGGTPTEGFLVNFGTGNGVEVKCVTGV